MNWNMSLKSETTMVSSGQMSVLTAICSPSWRFSVFGFRYTLFCIWGNGNMVIMWHLSVELPELYKNLFFGWISLHINAAMFRLQLRNAHLWCKHKHYWSSQLFDHLSSAPSAHSTQLLISRFTTVNKKQFLEEKTHRKFHQSYSQPAALSTAWVREKDSLWSCVD